MEMHVYNDDKNILLKEYFEKSTEDYHRFWQELCKKYPGWEVDLVYRNCDPPAEFVAEIGARILDSNTITEVTKETIKYANEPGATLVTDENFHIFAKLHEDVCPDFAYPNESIAKNMNSWRIFMHGNAYTMMSFWADTPEIFILKMANAEEGALLLAAAANYAFSNGMEKLEFYVDNYKPMEMEAAQKVGFITTGRSIAYRVDSLG